ncbi:hypothetical protein OOZ15_06415 [Galbibacter sp. EGI 63066]|nr:hypothetical protein [Galbibacter sp. EGI 63066]MCX2679573.1 hypothetical protein [Galbibacter sp. EGI 63066]
MQKISGELELALLKYIMQHEKRALEVQNPQGLHQFDCWRHVEIQ